MIDTFLSLDFETSGLDPKRHAPVTLGVCRFVNGEPTCDCAEWLFSPPMKDGKITREYDACALEISGTSWKRIKNEGMTISAVMAALSEFIGGAKGLPVVAFNAPFDLSFYSECLFLGGSWNQHLRRFETFKPPLVGPWQCARLLAVDRLSGLADYKLDTVAAHFGFSRSTDKHGALEDAILAGRVFAALQEVAA